MRFTRLHALSRTLPFLLTIPALVTPGLTYAQAPSAAEARAALQPASAQTQKYTRAQLDQMLAPIALYPDQLLTQVLMATTFPQQLTDAQSWLQDTGNAALQGDPLVAALQQFPWDPSVKSLIAFPQIVAMLTNHMDWSQALGIAFANQQVEVMARVQSLRDRAVTAGKLKTTKQMAVQRHDGMVIIEPADPREVYVPIYNPAEVYGTWADRGAPPVYIPPPPNYAAGAIEAGIAFGVASAVVAPLWGWGHPDWRRHEVIVDRQRFEHITAEPPADRRQIAVQNDVWHRVSPVVPVPVPERRAGAAGAAAQTPAGTAAPTVVVLPPAARAAAAPTAAAPPASPAAQPVVATPGGANQAAQPAATPSAKETTAPPAANQTQPIANAPASPNSTPAKEAAHPAAPGIPAKEAATPGAGPAPARGAARPPAPSEPAKEAAHPPGAPPSAAERTAPVPAAGATADAPHPAGPPHPTEAAHAPVAPPHPAEAPHAPAAPAAATVAPRPAEALHAPGPPLHPAEAPHPPAAPAAATVAPPRPAEPPHPPAAPAPVPAAAPQAAHPPAPPAAATAAHPASAAPPQPGGAPKKPAATDEKEKPKD